MRSAPAPLLPLALGLVAGLLATASTPALVLLAAPLLVAGTLDGDRRTLWRGALLGLLLGAAPRPVPPIVAALDLPSVHLVEGRVREAAPPGRRGTRLVLDVDRLGRAAHRFGLAVAVGEGEGPRCRPGDRIRAAVRLSPLRSERNPGDPGGATRWLRRGVHLRGWVEDPSRLEIVRRSRRPAALVADVRLAAAAVFDARLRSKDAGLARALALGDRGGLTASDRRRFQSTGQGHLIAVSGLHVGLLLAALLAALGVLGLGRRAGAALGLAAVLFYVPLAGARPSVVRAGSAAALYFGARLLGRQAGPLAVLAAVVIGVLVADPTGLQDAALTLSVAAVLGILLLARRLRDLLVPPRPVVPGVIEPQRALARRALAVSLAAWLGTAPLLALVFGRLCPLAALFSVLTVPLTALLVGAAFLLLLLGPVPGFAHGAAAGFVFVADALRSVLDLLVDAGLGTRPVAAPSIGWTTCYVGAFLAAGFAKGRRGGAALLALGVLLALLFAPARRVPPEHPRVVLLDVGHGQAAVVLLPDGRAALLDAGSLVDRQIGRRVVVPALGALGVRRLAVVTASHGDADHAVGLSDVARQVPVDRRIAPGTMRAGVTLLEGTWGRLRTVSPPARPRAERSPNDASLVVLLETAAGRRMLFPGDLGAAGVEDLLLGDVPRAIDVLLLPHHGLPGPGRDRLLEAVAAGALVASCPKAALPLLPPSTRATAAHGALVIDLLPAGAVVHTPFARRARRYDSASPMPLVASLALDPTTLGVVVALGLLAVLSWRLFRWLDFAGALGAFVLGTAAWLAFGIAGLAALLSTFLVATLLGRLPGAARTGARTLTQVAANGLVPLLGAALALAGYPVVGWAAFLGGLACLGADTSATEVGTRWGGTPRSPCTGRSMRLGESGGVTALGLVASIVGGALAPVAAWLAGAIDARAVGLVTLAGVVAALLDSVLGATLQYRGRDAATGRVTEARRTEAGPTERVSGLFGLDNDAVNLVAGIAGALLAVAWLA